MPHLAYLSLGSNLGDRDANLREAARRLTHAGEITAVSSLYETEPQELREQPWFLNAALALRTQLAPDALLAEILAIEKTMGRVRNEPKGPRKIDIDIVLYDDEVVNAPGLVIPHPAMTQRLFVLAPMAEIAPQTQHPSLHRTLVELRDALTRENGAQQSVHRLTAPWFSNA